MRAFLRKTGLVMLRAINRGGQHHCPVCQRRFARFMRRGDNLMCVGCRSYARHRLMMLYIQRETDLLRKPGRVLHLAPEPGLHDVLASAPTMDYVTADLEAGPHVQVQPDARNLPFGDDSFDAILCSHVLEHMPEEITVAREMARVVNPDGVGRDRLVAPRCCGTTPRTASRTTHHRQRLAVSFSHPPDRLPTLCIRHIRTRPYRPRTNGKAEAFIRILQREWAYAYIYPTSSHRAKALPGWLRWYNNHRPHGGIGGHPPISRVSHAARSYS
jgi:SAM-dependent methyltransferase